MLHTRTLIEFFYPKNPRRTDINITCFISSNSTTCRKLQILKKQIEVHVLHITDWRDSIIRSKSNRADIQRPDWNKENGKIFNCLIKLLEDLSNRLTSPWSEALKNLKNVSEGRFKNGSKYNWPKELGEEKDVKTYLQNLIVK